MSRQRRFMDLVSLHLHSYKVFGENPRWNGTRHMRRGDSLQPIESLWFNEDWVKWRNIGTWRSLAHGDEDSSMGHHVTVVSSSDKKKVEAMKHLDADEYLAISESHGLQKAADSVDYIIETVPVFHPLQPYLSLLKLNGKLILTGAIDTTLQFVVPMVMLGVDRKSIKWSFIETMKETVEMLQFCKKKELTSMIKVGKMDHVNAAMERIEKSDVSCRVSQEGKVVSIGRKMKEKIKGYFPSLILYFKKSRTHEFSQEVSNTKQITKKDENKRWIKFCLMLFLVLTTGPIGVRNEDVGNLLIPGSTAMKFLPANKNLGGLSERHQTLGSETNGNFNYRNFPRGYSPPNGPPRKQANPHQRPCNPSDHCRQGKKGKN